ncbi:MAG: response regulator [Thermoanaerobaculia bacterium]
MAAVKKRILIVEDNPCFLGILARLLKPWNAEISSTLSGAEAIGLLEGREFDLILIDLQLPSGDGPQLLDFVSARKEALMSRCLIVTGFPGFGKALSDIPVVPKTNLVELGPHLLRVIGRPALNEVAVLA